MTTEFAAALIKLRGQKNLTQQELGQAAGVSPSQISRYEAGLAMPRKTVLRKLADALGVTVENLRSVPGSAPEHRLYEGFSTRFLNARANAKIKIKTLSERSGIEPKVLQEFELGTLLPSTDDLIRLSQALKIDIKDLSGAKDEEDVVQIHLQVEGRPEDDAEVFAITPDMYQRLLKASEELGISPSEIFNEIITGLADAIETPSDKENPFRKALSYLDKLS